MRCAGRIRIRRAPISTAPACAGTSSFDGIRLLVTHDPLEAMALADRVVVLEHGRVAQQGTIADVAARPRSPWVATMLGLNLFRGVATDSGIDVAGATIAALSDVRGAAFAVVHPRAIALHRSRPEGSPRNVWEGHADSLDHEGDRVRVRISGPIPVVAEVTPAAIGDLGTASGADYGAAYQAFVTKFCALDDGKAAARVRERLFGG